MHIITLSIQVIHISNLILSGGSIAGHAGIPQGDFMSPTIFPFCDFSDNTITFSQLAYLALQERSESLNHCPTAGLLQ